MHFTIPCSQLHYFALMSLKGFFYNYFVVQSTFNSCLLVEGDRIIVHIIFLHFIDFTYNNREKILKSKKLLKKHMNLQGDLGAGLL